MLDRLVKLLLMLLFNAHSFQNRHALFLDPFILFKPFALYIEFLFVKSLHLPIKWAVRATDYFKNIALTMAGKGNIGTMDILYGWLGAVTNLRGGTSGNAPQNIKAVINQPISVTPRIQADSTAPGSKEECYFMAARSKLFIREPVLRKAVFNQIRNACREFFLSFFSDNSQ